MIDISESTNLSRHKGLESDILALEGLSLVTIGKWYYSTDWEADSSKLLSVFLGVASDCLLKIGTDSLRLDTLEKRMDGFKSDAFHKHMQNTASNEWHIVHNLRKYPSVTVEDSGGTIIEGDVVYMNENALRIVFSLAFCGWCYCN
jgi:hypothetical protein